MKKNNLIYIIMKNRDNSNINIFFSSDFNNNQKDLEISEYNAILDMGINSTYSTYNTNLEIAFSNNDCTTRIQYSMSDIGFSTSIGGRVNINNSINLIVGIGTNLNKDVSLLLNTILIGTEEFDYYKFSNGPLYGTVGIQYNSSILKLYTEIGHGLSEGTQSNDDIYFRLNGNTEFKFLNIRSLINASILTSSKDSLAIAQYIQLNDLGPYNYDDEIMFQDLNVYTFDTSSDTSIGKTLLFTNFSYSKAAAEMNVQFDLQKEQYESNISSFTFSGRNNIGSLSLFYKDNQTTGNSIIRKAVNGEYFLNSTWIIGINQESVSGTIKKYNPSGTSGIISASGTSGNYITGEFDKIEISARANVGCKSSNEGVNVSIGYSMTDKIGTNESEKSISLALSLFNSCTVNCNKS